MEPNYEAAYFALYVQVGRLYNDLRRDYPIHKKDPAWQNLYTRLLLALDAGERTAEGFGASPTSLQRAYWQVKHSDEE